MTDISAFGFTDDVSFCKYLSARSALRRTGFELLQRSKKRREASPLCFL